MTTSSGVQSDESAGSEREHVSYRKLSGTLSADYDALHNDLEQANELIRVYQCQLSNKSNEFAVLKIVLEKAFADLTTMQADVEELRKQRNQIAHEASSLKARLARAEKDGDRLQVELNHAKDDMVFAERRAVTMGADRERLIAEREVLMKALSASERIISDLAGERDKLREDLRTTAGALIAAEATVREFWRKEKEREEQGTKLQAAKSYARNSSEPPSPLAREFIELSFGGIGPDVSVVPAAQ